MAKRNVFRVSQSKIALWRKCRYAYHLRYVEGIRRRAKARPLQFGTLVHTMLEADANSQNPYSALDKAVKSQKLFASEREELQEIASDVKFIMRDYFEFWDDQPASTQLEFIKRRGKSAEHEIILDLCDGIEIIVKLDTIASNAKGMWLVENKTFRQMPSDNHRWRNLQSSIYKWAIDEVEIKVDGMCWNYIRSKAPTIPQLLKTGGLSKKRLDTLPSALTHFFKQEKVKPDHHMMKTAQKNRENFFIRTFTAFRTATVKIMLADFIETAKEIVKFHGISKAKTVDRHCDWCEYEPLCRAELTGSSTKFIRDKEYTNREQREAIELAQAD